MQANSPPQVARLKVCKHNFCIVRALTRAQQGDLETGLVFTGEFMPRIEEILSAKEIIRRLVTEAEEFYQP